MDEFEIIVEFSWLAKQEKFVVRFLDGRAYSISIVDLPKHTQTKSPNWEDTFLSPKRNALQLIVNKELREIPYHLIHAHGTPIE